MSHCIPLWVGFVAGIGGVIAGMVCMAILFMAKDKPLYKDAPIVSLNSDDIEGSIDMPNVPEWKKADFN